MLPSTLISEGCTGAGLGASSVATRAENSAAWTDASESPPTVASASSIHELDAVGVIGSGSDSSTADSAPNASAGAASSVAPPGLDVVSVSRLPFGFSSVAIGSSTTAGAGSISAVGGVSSSVAADGLAVGVGVAVTSLVLSVSDDEVGGVAVGSVSPASSGLVSDLGGSAVPEAGGLSSSRFAAATSLKASTSFLEGLASFLEWA